jgi:cellulose synthase/poly-beta-1,6-N-acetylglucosamine synthase-like glycosyltransferase
MHVAEIILWIAFALLIYTYLGYPALIRLWSALRRPIAEPMRISIMPSITVVVVAHNEERVIRARLRNILAQDYPKDHLRVVLASDGSTDATADEARSVHSARVNVVQFNQRRGKAAVLNDIVPVANGEIVVFCDARQHFESNALRELAATFEDPKVGAASGELMLDVDNGTSEVSEGVGFYWRYEKFLRRHESRVDSTVGVTGAIYAIRRHLFERIPPSTILDDVLIPMQIVRQGYRAVFEPRAVAHDRISGDSRREFQRKLRTIAGNFQLFGLKPWLLIPFANRLWLQTISHKLARLLSPVCLCLALATSCYLVSVPFYRYCLVAQIAFYVLAIIGYLVRRKHHAISFMNIPYTFCLLNVATIMAFFSLLSGHQRVTWRKTDNNAESIQSSLVSK